MTQLRDISGDDIASWATQHIAISEIAELVRRLIHATTAMAEVDIRTGSGVHLSGYDGIVRSHAESPFCPEGTSVWEFSTSSTTKSKLDKDYEARSSSPGNISPRQTSFILVNARRIASKQDWVAQRNDDHRWLRVLVYDADDLARWLSLAPAVAIWFSHKHLLRPAYDLIDAERFVEIWANQTNPRLPIELLLSGREKPQDAISRWLEKPRLEPGECVVYVRANSADEARIFAISTILALPEEIRKSWIARVTVVESLEAWRWVARQRPAEPILLIPNFTSFDLAGYASNMIRVIIPADRSSRPVRREVIEVTDPIPWRLVEEALKRSGLTPSESRDIANHSRGQLLPLRRLLGLPTKAAWDRPEDRAELLALGLLGAWDPNNGADCSAVEALSASRERLEELCIRLAAENEAPIEQVGRVFRWKSHRDAWQQLHVRCPKNTLLLFAKIAIYLLNHESHHYRQGVLPSNFIREGVVTTIGLISLEDSNVALGIVEQVLQPHYERWSILAKHLPLLAEAAPYSFLDALDGSLQSEIGVAMLLSPEHESLFGTPVHLFLQEALESLAWTDEYCSRAAELLARLASVDQGDRHANRPASSLANIFHLVYPQTIIDEDERHELLEKIVATYPEEGWNLLRSVLRALEGGFLPRSRKPTQLSVRWPVDKLGTPDNEIIQSRVKATFSLLLQAAGNNGSRWAEIVKMRPDIRGWPTLMHQSLEVLDERVSQIQNSQSLRNALREEISSAYESERHENEVVNALEKSLKRLTPSDPIQEHAWHFERGFVLPEPHTLDYSLIARRRSQMRDDVFAVLFDSEHALQTAGQLLLHIGSEELLAGAIVRSSLSQVFEDGIILEKPIGELHRLVVPLASALYENRDTTWLKSTVEHWIEDGRYDDAKDLLLKLWPRPAVWDLLEELGDPLRSDYWSSVGNIGNHDEEQWERAIKQLVKHKNTGVALGLASYKATGLNDDILLSVLAAYGETPKEPPLLNARHSISSIFSELDDRLVSSEDSRKGFELELRFAELLAHSRRPFHFTNRVLARSPKTFLDFAIYSRTPDPNQKRGIPSCYHILYNWRGWPGEDLDDPREAEVTLRSWVYEVLSVINEAEPPAGLLTELSNVLVRPPNAEDGHWPCFTVRELLASRYSKSLRDALHVARYNFDHMRVRHVPAGIDEDRKLADQFSSSARVLRVKWPETARLLDELAHDYRRTSDNTEEWQRRVQIEEGYPPENSKKS